MSPDGRGELHALLALDRLPGLGPAGVRRLVRRFGSAEAAQRAPARAFEQIAGRPAALARTEPSVQREVEAAMERARAAKMRAVTWAAPGYPPALRQLADPPPVLFLRGREELLRAEGVTVVGARRATSRSRDLAERLARRLAEAGLSVVSGLALGVDGAAHRGALASGGDTVAVLGTGADVPYPRAHTRLFHEVLERGLVVSEFLPGTPALPHHFPRRNRILAALGGTTVVVEAGTRSGALITVDHALDLGRDVWVVPGPIEQGACAGSNRLLVEGARPLLSIEHFVSAVAPPGPALPAAEPPGGRGDGLEDGVLDVLREAPASGDEVAARMGVPAHEALRLLTALELAGAIRRLPGMRFGPAR